ncbi:hypothetical protein AB838_10480 [Rhodobacteraceae bacterium (ex Bugula neritina AB1)]|nr:hypothetical protein AB838_10480 [Rhodobacteraceae bacterium (ex Bugula neritina AB1)]
MSVKTLAGFAAVCGLLVLGVDYEQQSRRAGLELGQLTAGAYYATVETRVAGARADRQAAAVEKDRLQRWKQGGKMYLPQAPEGMERFSLAEQPYALAAAGPEGTAVGSFDIMDQALDNAEVARWAKKRDSVSWGYRSDEDIAILSVRLIGQADKNSLQGMLTASMGGISIDSFDKKPFAVIGGVAYQVGPDRGAPIPGLRAVSGGFGFAERAVVTVTGNASDNMIRTLLAAVDYDGLNSLMLQPVPVVGNDVLVPLETELDLAKAILDLQRDLKSMRAKAVQMKIEGIQPGKLMAGTLLHNSTGGALSMDVSDGESPDLDAMLEASYREGRAGLMAEAGVFIEQGGAVKLDEAALQPEAGGAAAQDGGGFGLLASFTEGLLSLPQDEAAPTSEVIVSKGLAQNSGSSDGGCIRRGTVRTCD